MNNYSILASMLVFITLSNGISSDDPFDLICLDHFGNSLEIVLNSVTASCPSGWTDYGLECVQNCRSGYSTNIDQITCTENCRSGYTEVAYTCQKWSWCTWKPCISAYIPTTYTRSRKFKDVCPSGTSLFDGNCFGSCPDNYINIGIGECECDTSLSVIEMYDFLLNKQSVLTRAVSCVTDFVDKISETETGLTQAQVNNPATVFSQYTDALDTFSTCTNSLDIRRRMADSNDRVFSWEFAFSGATGVSGSASIGIVIDPENENKKYYYSTCTGYLIDVSAGASLALAYSENLDSIAGTSDYITFGADVIVAGVGYTASDDFKNWAVGFEIGAGILPLNFGEGTCVTNWL